MTRLRNCGRVTGSNPVLAAKKKTMNVSMDGLRKRLISDYNSLTRKLNANVGDASFDPEIIIAPDSIRREMEGIRNSLITLAFCYIEGQEGFSSLEDNTHFEIFFEEGEEESN